MNPDKLLQAIEGLVGKKGWICTDTVIFFTSKGTNLAITTNGEFGSPYRLGLTYRGNKFDAMFSEKEIIPLIEKIQRGYNDFTEKEFRKNIKRATKAIRGVR